MLKVNDKKGKFMYCNECCERTFHKKLGSSSQFANDEVVRGFAAVYTLGLSELINRTKYHKCIECGNIYEEL